MEHNGEIFGYELDMVGDTIENKYNKTTDNEDDPENIDAQYIEKYMTMACDFPFGSKRTCYGRLIEGS